MAVGKTIIKQDEIQVQKLKVDNITTDVQVNNTLSLNGEKSLSINYLSSGSVKIENHTGGTVNITSQNGGSVTIDTMYGGSNTTINSIQNATLNCPALNPPSGTEGKINIGSINAQSDVWVSDQLTISAGEVRIACGENGKITGGHVRVGAYGGTINGGNVTVGKMSSGEIVQEGVSGGTFTITSLSGGITNIPVVNSKRDAVAYNDTNAEGYGDTSATLYIKPAQKLIYNYYNSGGTTSIRLGKSFFETGHLYHIWLSSSSGDGGEFGFFVIPGDGRHGTTALYRGGSSDNDGDVGWIMSFRAYSSSSGYNTNFSSCDHIEFRRFTWRNLIHNKYEDGTLDGKTKFTRMRIWDLGIDFDLSAY